MEKEDFYTESLRVYPNNVTDKYLWDGPHKAGINPKWQHSQDETETFARCRQEGCEHVWNTYVVPLQERLNLEKESNHLLHGAMVSAESRGAKKGREEMESEIKALRDWKESALAVFAEWDRVSDYIKPRCRLGDKYSARALELFKMIDAENKALKEEINALNGDIQSYRNGHEVNAKRYNDLLIERNKLGEEIERLEAEVLKEKFPEN